VTADQADEVLAVLRMGAVPQELSDERVKLFLLFLRPLPYERSRRAVLNYVASADPKGAPKFVSSVDELLEACGIPAGARGELTRAVQDGGELLPDLRSVSGWSYVPPCAEPPPGVAEAEALARGALEPPERPALPAPTEGIDRGAALDRIRGTLGRRRSAEPPDRWARVDAAMATAVSLPDEVSEMLGRLRRAEDQHLAEAAALRELRAAVREELEQGNIPLEAVEPAVRALLGKLDLVGGLEAVRDVHLPELVITELKVLREGLDDDAVAARVVLGKPS